MGYWSEQLRLRLGSGALSCSLSPPFLSISHLLQTVFLSVLLVSSPPTLVLLSPILFHTHKKADRLFVCIRQSLRISLPVRAVPLTFPVLWKWFNLKCSKSKRGIETEKYSCKQDYSACSASFLTIYCAAVWYLFTWDFLSITHSNDCVVPQSKSALSERLTY